jgi:exopolysaccharide biosynthesis polyprenyl glycosylphosphotransferase
LIFGGTAAAFELAHAIQQAGQDDKANPFGGTGYQIVGLVADTQAEDVHNDIPILGEERTLVRMARQYGVDEIILAVDDEKELSDEAREVLLDSRELGLRITSLVEVYERLTGQLPVEYSHCNLSLLLSPANSPAARLYHAVKRLMDVVMALVGLAFLAMLLPFVALANALGSPGPLFYRQERVGLAGKPFPLVKLRSMVPDAERRVGAVWCGEDDPRITPIGRILRKTRLDELPQFLNVLRGEMTVIGPRPERPYFVGQLAKAMPIYRARHAAKPGITGWAQVHYEYGNSVEDARTKLKYDLYYVKHANLFLDFLILLHTVRVVLGAQGQ